MRGPIKHIVLITPLLAALLLSLMAAGCGQGRRTTLVIAETGGAVSLDPHTQDEFVTINILTNVYEGLVGFDPHLKIVPLLATGYDNPWANTWRFHLRPGARFHDGRPVQAWDVIYSLKRARDLPGSRFASVLSPVLRISALDSMTVEVRTDRPRPTLINTLATVAVVPRGFEPGDSAVGTGPYRFVRFLENRGVMLQRFEGYWGQRPYIDQVEFRNMPDGEARTRAATAGLVDLDAALAPDQRRQLEDRARLRLVETPFTTTWLLGCDVRGGARTNPLADRRVRQALSLAIDREGIIARALDGYGEAANQIAPPTIVGYNPNLPGIKRDVAAARALLRQSGIAEGRELRLALKPANLKVGLLIKEQLAEAGIVLAVDTVGWDSLYRRIEDGKVPFYMFGQAFSYGDVSEPLNELHTRDRGELGQRNTSGYGNPRLDSLIETASREFDPSKRQAMLQRAMALAAEDLPFIPLFFQGNCYAIRRGMRWTPRSDEMILAKEFRPGSN